MTKISPITNLVQQSEVETYTQTLTLTNMPSISDEAHIWSLYFDRSKSKEGIGARCVLIDPTGNNTFVDCRLEFECTNNTTEYKAHLQGFRKALDMDVRNLIVFGDSKIMVK